MNANVIFATLAFCVAFADIAMVIGRAFVGESNWFYLSEFILYVTAGAGLVSGSFPSSVIQTIYILLWVDAVFRLYSCISTFIEDGARSMVECLYQIRHIFCAIVVGFTLKGVISF